MNTDDNGAHAAGWAAAQLRNPLDHATREAVARWLKDDTSRPPPVALDGEDPVELAAERRAVLEWVAAVIGEDEIPLTLTSLIGTALGDDEVKDAELQKAGAQLDMAVADRACALIESASVPAARERHLERAE